MPAGDLIEARPSTDWPLVELRATLMGKGTGYLIGPPGIRGLGVKVKDADIDLAHDRGDHAAEDYEGPLQITVPLLIGSNESTAADAASGFVAMRAVWTASASDLELHLQLPGWGHIYVTGRPRGLDDDLVELEGGVVAALAHFKANDPTITVVA